MEAEHRIAAESDLPITRLVAEWFDAAGLRLRGSLRLAMAETKLAVTTFALMIFLVVLAAGAVMLAWALLLGALVQVLALAGLQLALALTAIAALHFALAWGLWRQVNRLSRHMEFRATRGLLES